MGFQSAELKLRNLAMNGGPGIVNAALVADLTWNNTAGVPTFMWMDRQLVQGDLGKPSDGRAAVYVHRVSSAPRISNQGQLNTALSQPRLQFDIVAYNAEQARSCANDFIAFFNSISLAWNGYYQSPVTGPSQAPCRVLNEREGILPQLNPPPYVWTMDVRFFCREDFPN